VPKEHLVSHHVKHLRPLAALCALGVLAACESEATLPDPVEPGPTSEVTVDASSTSAFTYFSLATGQAVTVASPSTSTQWDLAIRRYEVRLNGGVAGPGSVDAALVIDNSAQPTATILGYTAASQLAAFEAITAEDIPAASAFTSTALAVDAASWFRASGATLVANPARAWKVRRADGGYAVMRVSAIALNGNALGTFSLEYRLQASAGGTLGPVQTLTVPAGAPSAPTRISLASGSAVVTDGCTWDVAISAALVFTVNTAAGCNAGTFPLDSSEPFATVTTAADAPAYGAIISALSGPIANSVFAADHPPFLYNLDPQNAPNRLSPTFNVYLVRSGSSVYKVQFLGYYSATGTPGHVTMRVAKLQ
jgi:hypothetical protein